MRIASIVRLLLALTPSLGAASCPSRTEPLQSDTSHAKLIPAEVAVANLREVLPTTEVVCVCPSGEQHAKARIRGWEIDGHSIGVRLRGADPLRWDYSEIGSLRLERSGRYFQVRVFDATGRGLVHFAWQFETTARQVLELLEALRQKRRPGGE
jgi:hypothetical protein